MPYMKYLYVLLHNRTNRISFGELEKLYFCDKNRRMLSNTVCLIGATQPLSGGNSNEPMSCHVYCGQQHVKDNVILPSASTLIARFMGPTWDPSGADRTQVGAMLAP